MSRLRELELRCESLLETTRKGGGPKGICRTGSFVRGVGRRTGGLTSKRVTISSLALGDILRGRADLPVQLRSNGRGVFSTFGIRSRVSGTLGQVM